MIAMQLVDAEFVGDGANWPTVIQILADQKLVSPQHIRNLSENKLIVPEAAPDSAIFWWGYLQSAFIINLGE